jgi:hypothetical protein
MNDKTILYKKIDEALTARDHLKKKLEDRGDDILNIEPHIQGFYSILYGKRHTDKHKNIELYTCVPNYHINAFPVFIKNSKYILAIFSLGVPTKYPVKGTKLDKIFYTVGYKSKRLFYKHKGYQNMDDNYIMYHCRTLYENNRLIFEIKTDDGLCITGDGRSVLEEMRNILGFKLEYKTTEEFFGMCNEEVNALIKDKYDIGCRK